jgi:predicted acyltransferase
MIEPPVKTRLLSLDAFRGFTIAAMVLVNDPGSWDSVYWPLRHAEWNGWTPTDLIFPFFLFIAGVSIALSLTNRVNAKDRSIYLKIFRRSVLLFLIGVFLNTFPFYNFAKHEWIDPGTIRIMGVLQRIAICYFVTAIIFLHTDSKQQTIIAIGLLLIYWLLMTFIDVPTCLTTSVDLKPCNAAAYIDRLVLTESHMWQESKVFDPEGLLSTIPAIASTIAGVLAGKWLFSSEEWRVESEETDLSLITRHSPLRRVSVLLLFGLILIALGYIWSFWFPINKNIWTGSYVVFTTGWALCTFAICYWLIDVKKYAAWAKPFIVFGVNAIALYVGASILEALLGAIVVTGPDGDPMPLQTWIFNNIFLPVAEPINASLAYAICTVLLWLFLMWLLYRKRIFIRL